MKKVFILILSVFVSFSACSSPESAAAQKRTKLEMRLSYDPIVLSGYVEYYTNGIVVSETNGVGGNITSGTLEWRYQNASYETYNFSGKKFRAYESWEMTSTFYIQYRYDKVRATIRGTDDNGFSFNFQKEWPIYYR